MINDRRATVVQLVWRYRRRRRSWNRYLLFNVAIYARLIKSSRRLEWKRRPWNR